MSDLSRWDTTREATERLQRLSDRSARLLADARAAARRARADLALQRHRHAEVVGSRLRLAILGWRSRVVHLLRHPADSVTYLVRLSGERPAVASVRQALGRFLQREAALNDAAQINREAGPGGEIRSLGSVRVRAIEREAFFAHPPTTLAWRLGSMPGGSVVAWVTLVPQTWATNIGGVEFGIQVTDSAGRTRSRTRVVQPTVTWCDRMWRPLRVPLWPDVTGDVEVRLTTRLPPQTRGDYAWAMWGDPAIVSRRPLGDVLRSMRVALRSYGVRGSVTRLFELGHRSLDAEQYRAWCRDMEPAPAALEALSAEVASWPDRPRFSIITPVRNTDPAHLRACLDSVRSQIYPDWELCLADDASDRSGTLEILKALPADPRIRQVRLPTSGHICAASNAALAMATGDYVVTLDHDDVLPRHALAEVARALRARPETDFLYSDEDKLDEAGARCEPHFKPDWSSDLFRSYMYTCHLLVLRRSLVMEVGGFREGLEGAQDYDLVLRAIERSPHIFHLPKVLYHWRKSPGSTASAQQAKLWAVQAGRRALEEHVARTGVEAEVSHGMAPGLYRVRYKISNRPRVSLVVLAGGGTRDVGGRQIDLLANTIRSIVRKTTYREYELVVVDSGLLPPESVQVLQSVPHRRLSFPHDGPFNFSRKVNFAVSEAAGPHVVLLNDDLEVIASEWLTAMLEFSQQPEIGAVGARLLFPDGRLQHVGMLVGVGGVAAHPLHMFPGSHTGYFGSAITVRNCSAVTAACLMTRKAVFEEVGGFDEGLAIDFNDVDFCLKIRRAGYRIVYTPYAQLYHLESSSIGGRIQNPAELERMRLRWTDELTAGDPYYNPNLTRDFLDYRLASPERVDSRANRRRSAGAPDRAAMY